MRSRSRFVSLAALVLTHALAACDTTDGDPAPTDGGPSVLTCGDGSVAGDGGCVLPTRLDVAIDPADTTTELGTSVPITVTFTGSDGFGGSVDLSAVAVDDAGEPMVGWSVVLDASSVDVPPDGTALVHGSVIVPTLNVGLVARVRVTAASDAASGTHVATAAISVLDQLSIHVSTDALGCVYPAAGTTYLRVGSTLRWVNDSAAPMTIHVEGNDDQCAHQPVSSPLAPGEVYSCVIAAVDLTPFSWNCHLPGPNQAGLAIEPVAP